MDSPSKHSKRYKPSTPTSESQTIYIDEEDPATYKHVCKASSSPLFLSPLGGELLQQAQQENKKIDLQAINQQIIDSDVKAMIKKDEDKERTKGVDTETEGDKEDKEDKAEDSKPAAVVSSFIQNNNDLLCDQCGLSPCDGVTYEIALQTAGLEAHKRNNGHNRATRHHLYKFYIASKYGSLGRWNRVRIPQCIELMIHKMYPDPNGDYVGFRNSGAPFDADSSLKEGDTNHEDSDDNSASSTDDSVE